MLWELNEAQRERQLLASTRRLLQFLSVTVNHFHLNKTLLYLHNRVLCEAGGELNGSDCGDTERFIPAGLLWKTGDIQLTVRNDQ